MPCLIVVIASCLRLPCNSGFRDALSSGGQATFALDILATLTSRMLCPLVVRSLSPGTSSKLWVPRCPELGWSVHFRLRHPRNSDLGDTTLHGGLATFAWGIRGPRIPRCPELRWSGHIGLRYPCNSDLGYALSCGGPATLAYDILVNCGL